MIDSTCPEGIPRSHSRRQACQAHQSYIGRGASCPRNHTYTCAISILVAVHICFKGPVVSCRTWFLWGPYNFNHPHAMHKLRCRVLVRSCGQRGVSRTRDWCPMGLPDRNEFAIPAVADETRHGIWERQQCTAG